MASYRVWAPYAYDWTFRDRVKSRRETTMALGDTVPLDIQEISHEDASVVAVVRQHIYENKYIEVPYRAYDGKLFHPIIDKNYKNLETERLVAACSTIIPGNAMLSTLGRLTGSEYPFVHPVDRRLSRNNPFLCSRREEFDSNYVEVRNDQIESMNRTRSMAKTVLSIDGVLYKNSGGPAWSLGGFETKNGMIPVRKAVRTDSDFGDGMDYHVFVDPRLSVEDIENEFLVACGLSPSIAREIQGSVEILEERFAFPSVELDNIRYVSNQAVRMLGHLPIKSMPFAVTRCVATLGGLLEELEVNAPDAPSSEREAVMVETFYSSVSDAWACLRDLGRPFTPDTGESIAYGLLKGPALMRNIVLAMKDENDLVTHFATP